MNHTLRVLFVIPGDGSGSSMIFVRRQIDSLRSAGVTAAEFYLPTRTSPAGLLRERHRLRQMLRDFAPHLVHAQYGTVTACFCLLSTRLPVVITFRNSDLNPCPGISRVRSAVGRLLSQFAVLGASAITCVSEQLRGRLWWRREAAQVIPSGVDLDVFYPRAKSEARAELGWRMDERVIVFNAGGDPLRKRLDLAQRAAEVTSTSLDAVRLCVLDGGTPPGSVPVYLNAADCLLVTSLFEGSPNIVKEAMACDLPVISVDVGDVRERLDGICPSAIVSPEPNEIARRLVEVLSRPVRSNGSTKVEEISTRAVAGRILKVYQAALRRKEFVRPGDVPVAVAAARSARVKGDRSVNPRRHEGHGT